MSYQRLYPASAVQSEDDTYDRDSTAMYQSLTAFHGGIINGYDVAFSSPDQKAFDDFIEGVRRIRYEENIAYSPRMNQSATGYGASMATSHFSSNGEYDASAYGNMSAMGAGFTGNQLAFANNLQLDTAVPAHASTWAAEDFSAFPMDDFAAAAMDTQPPAPTMQYTYAQEYLPPNDPPSGYLPYITDDYLGFNSEPADVPAPIYPPGLGFTGTHDSVIYDQPAHDYFPASTFTPPTPTFAAHAHTARSQLAPPDYMTSADWQPQPAQPPVTYAQPNISNASCVIDPRQLHATQRAVNDARARYDADAADTAHRAHVSPGTPSLGYFSGSSATSASPATPTGPARPSARALGKRKAVDAGVDGNTHGHHHGGAAQTSAQPHPRPVKKARVKKQPARAATTVNPRRGIPSQTGVAALTHPIVNSVASGHGTQVLANLTPEILPQVGAGPSTALSETVSPVQEREEIPLWKQEGLTEETVKEEAEKMDHDQLKKNLMEGFTLVYVRQVHEKCKKREYWKCRWPGCKSHQSRAADTVRHIETVHLLRLEPCPRCGEMFRKDTLGRHMGAGPCREMEAGRDDIKEEGDQSSSGRSETEGCVETSGDEKRGHGGLEGVGGDAWCEGLRRGRFYRATRPQREA